MGRLAGGWPSDRDWQAAGLSKTSDAMHSERCRCNVPEAEAGRGGAGPIGRLSRTVATRGGGLSDWVS